MINRTHRLLLFGGLDPRNNVHKWSEHVSNIKLCLDIKRVRLGVFSVSVLLQLQRNEEGKIYKSL